MEFIPLFRLNFAIPHFQVRTKFAQFCGFRFPTAALQGVEWNLFHSASEIFRNAYYKKFVDLAYCEWMFNHEFDGSSIYGFLRTRKCNCPGTRSVRAQDHIRVEIHQNMFPWNSYHTILFLMLQISKMFFYCFIYFSIRLLIYCDTPRLVIPVPTSPLMYF